MIVELVITVALWWAVLYTLYAVGEELLQLWPCPRMRRRL